MQIVVTGSLGHISRPLVRILLEKGHSVTVISSSPARKSEILALGATAHIGNLEDRDCLTSAFAGADVVYTMMPFNAHSGAYSDQSLDVEAKHIEIARNYAAAIQNSGVSKVVHLSTIGAHTGEGVGLLNPHHEEEAILNQLPDKVGIKMIRPVGFYYNMLAFIPVIKGAGAIIQNYGGDEKEPWVAPEDIAAAIAEEMERPFVGRSVRYVASDEASPNEVAKVLGEAIGKPDLQWLVFPDNVFYEELVKAGLSPQVAKGITEMNASRVNGRLYEDYFRHRPTFGRVKLIDFAEEFATKYKS